MEWSRRRAIRACGVGALAALTAGAGCLDAAGSPLRIERVWVPEGGDASGDLLVRARVRNPSGSRASAAVYLYAGVGDDTLVRRRHASVAAGATTTVEASLDVPYADALERGVSARADVHLD